MSRQLKQVIHSFFFTLYVVVTSFNILVFYSNKYFLINLLKYSMAGACGRSNRSQSKAMIFSLGVRKLEFLFFF